MLDRVQQDKRLFLDYRQTGDRASRETLIRRFLPLARSLARRYARGSEPLDDLEQVASLALVKAVDSFDVSRDTAFSSYAVPSIVGAIKRHYRDSGWAVRPPRELQELALHVNRLNDELTSETGSPPTPAQIAAQAGVSVEAVLEAREAYRGLHSDSLDQPRGESEDGGTLIDTIGAFDTEIRRAFDRVALEALLERLDDRERLIVELYYQHELTQSEIGTRLGLSQMHISRLLRGAVGQLLAIASAQQAELSPPAVA